VINDSATRLSRNFRMAPETGIVLT
jgi:hypothetical protein